MTESDEGRASQPGESSPHDQDAPEGRGDDPLEAAEPGGSERRGDDLVEAAEPGGPELREDDETPEPGGPTGGDLPLPVSGDERRPSVVVISVAVLVMVAFVGLLAYSLMTRQPLTLGDGAQRNQIAAPAFVLSQLNGDGEVSLADFDGSPIVVNFWASWCAPCRVEMPHLVRAFEEYSDEGVVFIGVAIQDTNEDALAFIQEFNVPLNDGYIMVTDPDGTATIDYGVGGLPITFFIDPDGTVSTRWAGVVNGELLDVKIAELRAPAGSS